MFGRREERRLEQGRAWISSLSESTLHVDVTKREVLAASPEGNRIWGMMLDLQKEQLFDFLSQGKQGSFLLPKAAGMEQIRVDAMVHPSWPPSWRWIFLRNGSISGNLAEVIVQESEQLVLTWDENLQVVYVNPSLERILGYDGNDLLGGGWWNLPLRPENELDAERHGLMAARMNCMVGAVSVRRQEIMASNGEIRHVQWKDKLTPEGLLLSMGLDQTEEHHNNLLRSVIFNIAEASSQVDSPLEFYPYIHQEIRRVINTPNFYIAVYDPEADIVNFPYYADAADRRTPFSRKAGKGLTELTIRRKRPLLASKEDILELDSRGLIEIQGQSIPEIWLGVPLVHNHEVVGLITIQDYLRQDAFGDDDLALLTFIASQVSLFVYKLQQDEALKSNEQRFRALYDHSPVGIAQITFEGQFIQVNQRLAEIFGYTFEDLYTLGPLDLTFPDDLSVGMLELEELKQRQRTSYTVEKRYLKQNGDLVQARVNVSLFDEGGQTYIISVYEDISERLQAEAETAMLFSLSNTLNLSSGPEKAVTDTLKHVFEHGAWDYGEAWDCRQEPLLLHLLLRPSQEGTVLPKVASGPGLGAEDDIFWLESEDLQGAEFIRGKEMAYCGLNTVALLPVVFDEKLQAVLLLAAKRKWDAQERSLKVLSAARAQLRAYLMKQSAERAQLESEARYRAITEAAFEGIVVHRHGRILQANKAFANLVGAQPDELVGRHVLEVAADEENMRMLLTAVESNGTVEFKGRSRSGGWRHLQAVGRKGSWEGQPAGILAVRDVTLERQVEAAREEARIDARFRAYVQNSTEIILILDESASVLYASPQWLRYGSTSPGSDWLHAVLPEDLQEVKNAFQLAASENLQAIKIAVRLQTTEGEWRNFQVSFTNLLKDPMIKGVFFSAFDITDLKRTEQELIRKNFELDSFVYRASHDLKAPLNSLMGLQEIMGQEFADPAVHRYLGMMNKSVLKLDSFIRDLADFSRNDRSEMICMPVDWSLLVEDNMHDLKYMENAGRVDSQVEVVQASEFYSDPIRIGIVLNNLLSNAIKYQDLKKESPIMAVSVHAGPSQAILTITDNGIGIPEEHQAKVFNLFFRASVQSYGSGMGMYIVKSAVERLGGEISLSSIPGQGTTVTVILPNLRP